MLPWGKAVWNDILSGHWGLGTTPQQFADKLGCDPRQAYTGKAVGVLTTQFLVLSLTAARRDPSSLPKIGPLRHEMVRSGYTEAVREGRKLLAGKKVAKTPLDHCDYELLLGLHKKFDCWFAHHLDYVETNMFTAAYQEFAAGLAAELLAAPQLFPISLGQVDRTIALTKLGHLAKPGQNPASHLESLIETWEYPWLLTIHALEPLREAIR